jgi:hypothetical protein
MANSRLIIRTPNIFYFDGYATTWLIAGEANFPPDKKTYTVSIRMISTCRVLD